MQRLIILIFTLCAVTGLAAAQQSKKRPVKTVATKPATETATSVPQPKTVPLPSQQTVETFMHRMFGQDKNIKWRILSISPSSVYNVADVTVGVGDPPQITHLYVMPDGEHAIVGDVVPFGADPFLSTRLKLQVRATGPSKGPAVSKLQLVEFSDLQCPHCKAAHPIMERLMKDYPQAKIVFQHFPLGGHDWAAPAATYAQCVYEQDPNSFWRFLDAVFAAQGSITKENLNVKLDEIGATAGADTAKASACAQRAETIHNIQQSIDLGRTVGVTGTPTLYVNGRKIPNLTDIPYESLKQVIDFEAAQAK
jgi:protein-disulfide isomerase